MLIGILGGVWGRNLLINRGNDFDNDSVSQYSKGYGQYYAFIDQL